MEVQSSGAGSQSPPMQLSSVLVSHGCDTGDKLVTVTDQGSLDRCQASSFIFRVIGFPFIQ